MKKAIWNGPGCLAIRSGEYILPGSEFDADRIDPDAFAAYCARPVDAPRATLKVVPAPVPVAPAAAPAVVLADVPARAPERTPTPTLAPVLTPAPTPVEVPAPRSAIIPPRPTPDLGASKSEKTAVKNSRRKAKK